MCGGRLGRIGSHGGTIRVERVAVADDFVLACRVRLSSDAVWRHLERSFPHRAA